MTIIKRHIETKIERLLKTFPIVAIIGARQTGKTSLAKSLRSDWRYFDLEQTIDYDLITRDVDYFFNQYSTNIIIDEAQEYPDLFKKLRGVIDADRSHKGRFLITGSSSSELLKAISESLAGRIAIVELGTLKASEYYQKNLSSFYKIFATKLDKENVILGTPPLGNGQMQYIWLKGGYPEPLLSKDEIFYQQWIENYQKTYLNRDIAKLFPKLNKIAYRRFLNILGQLSATIINRSDLGRAIEISESTIKDYLEIAEGTFLWRNLPSFENNLTKAVVKRPKGYLRDSSLMHYFLKIKSYDELLNNVHAGHSFEAFVIEELIKGLQATLVTNWDTYYYRTRNGAEIDCILEGPFGVLPIEVKIGSTVLRKHIKTLTEFVCKHKLPFGILINQSSEAMWVSKHILQVPAGWL